MSLFKKSNNIKYRCFICGVEFGQYDEFKDHVVSSHEEGREYITCNLCGAVIRDRRLHHKAKHPGKPLPKSGQMRATVWYDFSGTKRKRNKSKPNFQEGYHVSPKNNFQPMHYRSGYELTVYQLLDDYNDVAFYEVEPADCVTNYFWNGNKKYFPDLKVRFNDGRTEVWEIKPSNQTDYDQNQAKWHACAEYVGRRGYAFLVKTEQGINSLRKLVLEQSRKI